MDYKESPSQTAGPYVHIGCMPHVAGLTGMYSNTALGAQMVMDAAAGERITFTGCIYDGEDSPLTDAMIEIWQADPLGRFGQNPDFSGWGRQSVDPDSGIFSFDTLKPGAVDDQAPHILIWIVARGINTGLTTRAYFEDFAPQNAADPVFQLAKARAQTMIAKKTPQGYHLNIHLQGDHETVFFDV